MSMFKSIVKSAVTMFVVGAILGLGTPFMASLLGYSVAQVGATPWLWTGMFFAGFGVLNTVLSPVMDKVFGKDNAVRSLTSSSAEHAPAIQKSMQPEMERAQTSTKFRDQVAVSRDADVAVTR